MNSAGNSGQDGFGGAADGSERPDFVGPDFAPPTYRQPPSYGQPAAPDFPSPEPQRPATANQPPTFDPGRSNGGGPRSKIVLITIAAVAVLAVIATVAVLVQRTRQPEEKPAPAPQHPSSARPSTRPSSSTPSRPADDELGRGLQQTGLACVRVSDAPVINHCGGKPGTSFSMLRWMVDDGRFKAFRFYGNADSRDDVELFERRIGQLHRAGLRGDDERKIIKAMPKSKKTDKTVDVSTRWGEVTVTYIEPVKAYQVIGTRDGTSVSFAGPTFEPRTRDLIKHLKGLRFSCKADSAALTCSHGSGTLSFYRAADDSYNYLSSVPRESAADQNVVDLLPFLLGSDVDTVRPMILDNLDAPFYLGGQDGYLVEISPGEVMIEGVSW
ncbi:hypothetical protein [Microlunatus soli]|uniref:Uncharacterized protein n=1 Tax=Microlunatus soli TaxID=630515 RepID=A0A1H1Y249_9ACTN|nr:hypothetical protein [Microlunatus soli]SDT15502.1 hypothetical protein SAMN04489812_4357 [Microlunatus soli]